MNLHAVAKPDRVRVVSSIWNEPKWGKKEADYPSCPSLVVAIVLALQALPS